MSWSAKRSDNRWHSKSDPFADLLFNALPGFTFLFLLAIMFMNPVAKKGIIDPKAEYIITVTWPDNNPNDNDTWVEDPIGNRIWFGRKEAGLVHLDRDDRGNLNHTITVNGGEVQNPLNLRPRWLTRILHQGALSWMPVYAGMTGKYTTGVCP